MQYSPNFAFQNSVRLVGGLSYEDTMYNNLLYEQTNNKMFTFDVLENGIVERKFISTSKQLKSKMHKIQKYIWNIRISIAQKFTDFRSCAVIVQIK